MFLCIYELNLVLYCIYADGEFKNVQNSFVCICITKTYFCTHVSLMETSNHPILYCTCLFN